MHVNTAVDGNVVGVDIRRLMLQGLPGQCSGSSNPPLLWATESATTPALQLTYKTIAEPNVSGDWSADSAIGPPRVTSFLWAKLSWGMGCHFQPFLLRLTDYLESPHIIRLTSLTLRKTYSCLTDECLTLPADPLSSCLSIYADLDGVTVVLPGGFDAEDYVIATLDKLTISTDMSLSTKTTTSCLRPDNLLSIDDMFCASSAQPLGALGSKTCLNKPPATSMQAVCYHTLVGVPREHLQHTVVACRMYTITATSVRVFGTADYPRLSAFPLDECGQMHPTLLPGLLVGPVCLQEIGRIASATISMSSSIWNFQCSVPDFTVAISMSPLQLAMGERHYHTFLKVLGHNIMAPYHTLYNALPPSHCSCVYKDNVFSPVYSLQIVAVEFSTCSLPGESLLLAAADLQARLWDAETGKYCFAASMGSICLLKPAKSASPESVVCVAIPSACVGQALSVVVCDQCQSFPDLPIPVLHHPGQSKLASIVRGVVPNILKCDSFGQSASPQLASIEPSVHPVEVPLWPPPGVQYPQSAHPGHILSMFPFADNVLHPCQSMPCLNPMVRNTSGLHLDGPASTWTCTPRFLDQHLHSFNFAGADTVPISGLELSTFSALTTSDCMGGKDPNFPEQTICGLRVPCLHASCQGCYACGCSMSPPPPPVLGCNSLPASFCDRAEWSWQLDDDHWVGPVSSALLEPLQPNLNVSQLSSVVFAFEQRQIQDQPNTKYLLTLEKPHVVLDPDTIYYMHDFLFSCLAAEAAQGLFPPQSCQHYTYHVWSSFYMPSLRLLQPDCSPFALLRVAQADISCMLSDKAAATCLACHEGVWVEDHMSQDTFYCTLAEANAAQPSIVTLQHYHEYQQNLSFDSRWLMAQHFARCYTQSLALTTVGMQLVYVQNFWTQFCTFAIAGCETCCCLPDLCQ